MNEQTNSWGSVEEILKYYNITNPDVELQLLRHFSDVKAKLISQEKEKWLQIIETKREECKKYPLKSTNGSIKNKTANDMVDVALLDIINLLQNK